MEDRRYGQRGYRDHDKERQGKPQGKSKEPSLPASRAMLQTRTVSRCENCGTVLPPLTDQLALCPKCKAALHSCRQCVHFDPGKHFECTQPVPERISDKSACNACTFFSLRVTVERDATSGSAPPNDPRRAFDDLFKKK